MCLQWPMMRFCFPVHMWFYLWGHWLLQNRKKNHERRGGYLLFPIGFYVICFLNWQVWVNQLFWSFFMQYAHCTTQSSSLAVDAANAVMCIHTTLLKNMAGCLYESSLLPSLNDSFYVRRDPTQYYNRACESLWMQAIRQVSNNPT